MYRAIGRLRTSESYSVAAPLDSYMWIVRSHVSCCVGGNLDNVFLVAFAHNRFGGHCNITYCCCKSHHKTTPKFLSIPTISFSRKCTRMVKTKPFLSMCAAMLWSSHQKTNVLHYVNVIANKGTIALVQRKTLDGKISQKGGTPQNHRDFIRLQWSCVIFKKKVLLLLLLLPILYWSQVLVNERACNACSNGSYPNANQTSCVALPIEHMTFSHPWAMMLVAVSTVGILMVLFILAIFIKFNRTPVIMASGRELCYMLQVGVVVIEWGCCCCWFILFTTHDLVYRKYTIKRSTRK